MEIRGIRVWDGERDRGVAAVRWRGDRIEDVAAWDEDRHPGLSLIPGLIDTHVHLVSYAGPDAVDYLTWPLVTPQVEQVLHGVAHALRALRVGVTTVRDLAADRSQVAIRHAFDQGVLLGPRVVAHGLVGMTAGHGDLFTPPDVIDRPPTADGPDACRRLVREYARMGADGIKVTTSGGVLSAGDRNEWRNYTRAELEAIVDEAHALAMPVAAHAHTRAGIQAALDVGVDSLEHATQITPAQAREAARRGVTVAPTLLILERIARGDTAVPEASRAKAQALFAARGEALRRAAAEGVEFVLGTDASGRHMPFGMQLDEVRAMARDLDLGDEGALVAATSRAARAVGMADRVGRVASGFHPDFVVVRGRPWQRIEDLTPANVVAVVARGQVVVGRVADDGTVVAGDPPEAAPATLGMWT
ncbi:MAG: amidohydrolase family protein [Firmicutes bacterium]|nr:amidohydrolase family protein [Bacillota bacterium]